MLFKNKKKSRFIFTLIKDTNLKMTSHIDFRTLPINIPSLCIPRVFPNIDEKRIRRIFNDLGLGEIDRIDIVGKTGDKGEKFNRIFVHFRRWFASANSDTARERLLNGKDIKIVYDDPWFWKVSAYRPPTKDAPKKQPPSKAAPRIQFDDSDGDDDKSRSSYKKPMTMPRQKLPKATFPESTHHLDLPIASSDEDEYNLRSSYEAPAKSRPPQAPKAPQMKPRQVQLKQTQALATDSYQSEPIPIQKRQITSKKATASQAQPTAKSLKVLEEGEVVEL
jgi:hypothetical protein